MIDHEIGTSVLEAIPARMFSILDAEFKNQAYNYTGKRWLTGVKIMQERTVPIDKVETDIITITPAVGDYSIQSVGSQHAAPYTFILEFVTKGKNTPTVRGDQSAGGRLLKLMMATRYVLMSPSYITLSGLPGIEGTAVSKLQIYKDERAGDASNIATGQLLFTVMCEEISRPNQGVLLAESDTDVRIGLTTEGFQYIKTT